MKALDKKLLRDLLRLRGQILAIVLVVACGLASFVAMASTYDSLKLSQANYYDQYRLAQVFVQLKRAPESLLPKIQVLPGVAQVQARAVMDVTVDVPGLKEPATGRLIGIPERPLPRLNALYIRQGRYLQPDRPEEVLVSEAFVKANRLKLGDRLGAVINGRWQKLHLVCQIDRFVGV
jgi:putative ABC transport system permease protein